MNIVRLLAPHSARHSGEIPIEKLSFDYIHEHFSWQYKKLQIIPIKQKLYIYLKYKLYKFTIKIFLFLNFIPFSYNIIVIFLKLYKKYNI